MKERIRELAEQAGFENGHQDRNGNSLSGELEKFAELIVRECAKVVDDMADPEDSERYFWAIQNASQKIIQHFGVKE